MPEVCVRLGFLSLQKSLVTHVAILFFFFCVCVCMSCVAGRVKLGDLFIPRECKHVSLILAHVLQKFQSAVKGVSEQQKIPGLLLNNMLPKPNIDSTSS